MKTKEKISMSILLILIVCLILLILFLLFRPVSTIPEAGIILDPTASTWEGPKETTAQAVQKGIRIPGYGTVYFPADSRTVNMTLYNPEKNDCYFSFSLYLDDEDTPIYSSDYIQPGMAIHELELDHALSPGHYTLHIRIDTYDPQVKAARNNASVKTELIVE